MERPDLSRLVDLLKRLIPAALLASCSAQAPPLSPIDVRESPRTEERGQWLYRAEIESPEGKVSLRLALRELGEGGFDLGAADALGQGVWRLAVRENDAIWIDLASRRFCRLGANATPLLRRFRAPLPATELSALLRGALPEAPADDVGGARGRGRVEIRDSSARRWTGERVADRWSTWTLWSGERPRLWFRDDGVERVLSGNDPAFQFRWRETARGELPAGAGVDTLPPEGFFEEACADAAGS